MALIPFRAILGNIDPQSFEKQPDGDFITGIRFNGKDVYKRTLEFSQISTWTPEQHDSFFVRAEGMLFDGIHYTPAKIATIGADGITLEQHLGDYTDGYIDLYYTENVPNVDRMAKFVFPAIAIVAGLVLALMSYSPEVAQLVFNGF